MEHCTGSDLQQYFTESRRTTHQNGRETTSIRTLQTWRRSANLRPSHHPWPQTQVSSSMDRAISSVQSNRTSVIRSIFLERLEAISCTCRAHEATYKLQVPDTSPWPEQDLSATRREKSQLSASGVSSEASSPEPNAAKLHTRSQRRRYQDQSQEGENDTLAYTINSANI